MVWGHCITNGEGRQEVYTGLKSRCWQGQAGKDHGELDVLQRRHRGNEVKGLEDKAHLPAPVRGQIVLVQRGDVLAAHPDVTGGGAVEPAQEIE